MRILLVFVVVLGPANLKEKCYRIFVFEKIFDSYQLLNVPKITGLDSNNPVQLILKLWIVNNSVQNRKNSGLKQILIHLFIGSYKFYRFSSKKSRILTIPYILTMDAVVS